ncbi:MAG: DUF4350 domain-containing protein [Actinobacteria bacterium]|nr:DUF4350 domain-containing protein [Actinomycetota bacterium]
MATVAPPSNRRRRAWGWAAIAIGLVLAGLVGMALAGAGQWAERAPLDPESSGPSGGRALAQILGERGVQVTIVRDRAGALAALGRGDTTLVIPDSPFLSDEALLELTGAAADVVVIEPHGRGMRLLFPGAEVSGFGSTDAIAPNCAFEAAHRSGPIVAGTLFAGADDAVACYPTEGGSALLTRVQGDGRVSAIDGSALFDNAHLAENGNAALAVNLLGTRTTLVWFVPTLADSDRTDASASLGDLTPAWVSPAIVLLLCAALAAAIWRGRRFGPLVAENLPVTVRAAETTEGRARLYARSRDTLHTADQLRIGALGRIARLLALGPSASAVEISDAAAQRVGADSGRVRGILIDSVPATERQLMTLSDDLHDLEMAVRAAVRPERSTP